LSEQPVKSVTNKKGKWIVMAGITLVAAGAISYFASPHPDGLERVAENHGFIEKAKEPGWTAWIPDYEFPGIDSPFVKVGLAGIIGVVALFGILYALTRPIARRGEVGNDGKGDHRPS
jgi:cobalt/nickel transport protein